MNANSEGHYEPYRDTAGEVGMGEAFGRQADRDELTREIEVLVGQIAILEEGLPRASGMERAALAKEINAYRERLESAQHALGAMD
jgi:hypothetical protein